MPTIAEIIGISKVSQWLSTTAIIRGGLYGNGLDLQLPRKLYCIRKNVEYRYVQEDIAGGETPSQELVSVSNKLYSLCYAVNEATNIFNNGTGGGSVTPASPQQFPIYITQDNFTTATLYPNTNLFGNNIAVFLNEFQRYLDPATEFEVLTTGLNITASGFDALSFTYTLVIEKVYS